MSALPKAPYTVQAYLAFESQSDTKHEYLHGEILQMAGASFNHERIVGNVFGNLFNALKGKSCIPMTSDMRVRVTPTRYTYPDLKVVCGTPQFDEANPPSLLNPVVVIEVASPSTKNYDLGDKSLDIRQLDSVQEYVVILQDEVRVVHYTRHDAGVWHVQDLVGEQANLVLHAVGCTLLLADVYDGVVMEA